MDERRSEPNAKGKKQERRSRSRRILGVAWRDIAIGIGALAVIVVTVARVRPIFLNQPQVAEPLKKRSAVARAALAPIPTGLTPADSIIRTERFRVDRKAFAADLVATGRMSQARADSIAFYAVREAHLRNVPPALIFGVMLTENTTFVSKAMSNVGAVGLMQIYPKIWLKELGNRFGRDLASDSTNLKYGVYILSHYLKTQRGQVSPREISRGLLRYNGCVTGSNTPNCHTYPRKISRYVEADGQSLCGDLNFTQCVARGFTAGFLAKPISGQRLDRSG